MHDYIESSAQVEEYLANVKRVLCEVTFDISNDFEILLSSIEGKPGYQNFETLSDLGYTSVDVRDVLLSLTTKDYHRTMIDNKEYSDSAFRVFGRQMNGKEVYIKIKIRKSETKQVFCISFHYASYPITKPFVV